MPRSTLAIIVITSQPTILIKLIKLTFIILIIKHDKNILFALEIICLNYVISRTTSSKRPALYIPNALKFDICSKRERFAQPFLS